MESGLASTELPVEEEVSGQNADREAQSTFDPVKKRPIWTVLRRNKQKKYTLIGALKRLIVLGLCFFSLVSGGCCVVGRLCLFDGIGLIGLHPP